MTGSGINSYSRVAYGELSMVETNSREKDSKIKAVEVVKERKGVRCRICTGCGLCPGVMSFVRQSGNFPASGQGIHVLAEDALYGEKTPLSGDGHVRLVTADVGTTTIAMLLYGSDGTVTDRYVSVNPQTKYGADVISRIRVAEKKELAQDMRRLAEEVLERGLRRFQRQLAVGESLFMVLAANTTMTYLLMGWETGELGYAPFTASHLSVTQRMFAGVPGIVFPGISAFVGGDIVAGIHACKMTDVQQLTLLVDLGTNGEMVLGNRDRRIACATAAGPAFEGGVNKGIWGADMVSLLARLRREEILDETGLLREDFFDEGIRIGNVHVTQEAVRNVQLAKAAIAAGIEILLERYGVPPEAVDRLVLAGGFGYYLDPTDAAEIGLLPGRLTDRAFTGGNTVLTGTLLAGRKLLMGEKDEILTKLSETAKRTEVINLASEPGFEERYLEAMKINKSE